MESEDDEDEDIFADALKASHSIRRYFCSIVSFCSQSLKLLSWLILFCTFSRLKDYKLDNKAIVKVVKMTTLFSKNNFAFSWVVLCLSFSGILTIKVYGIP